MVLKDFLNDYVMNTYEEYFSSKCFGNHNNEYIPLYALNILDYRKDSIEKSKTGVNAVSKDKFFYAKISENWDSLYLEKFNITNIFNNLKRGSLYRFKYGTSEEEYLIAQGYIYSITLKKIVLILCGKSLDFTVRSRNEDIVNIDNFNLFVSKEFREEEKFKTLYNKLNKELITPFVEQGVPVTYLRSESIEKTLFNLSIDQNFKTVEDYDKKIDYIKSLLFYSKSKILAEIQVEEEIRRINREAEENRLGVSILTSTPPIPTSTYTDTLNTNSHDTDTGDQSSTSASW